MCSVDVIRRELPFVTTNTAIRTFRHALSLDERRARFKANHYHITAAKNTETGVAAQVPETAGTVGEALEERRGLWSAVYRAFVRQLEEHRAQAERKFDEECICDETERDRKFERDMKEVWFAG